MIIITRRLHHSHNSMAKIKEILPCKVKCAVRTIKACASLVLLVSHCHAEQIRMDGFRRGEGHVSNRKDGIGLLGMDGSYREGLCEIQTRGESKDSRSPSLDLRAFRRTHTSRTKVRSSVPKHEVHQPETFGACNESRKHPKRRLTIRHLVSERSMLKRTPVIG